MKESYIENAVARWATEHGIMHLKLAVLFRRGYPDRIFFVPGGKPLLIEFKKPGETLTPLQAHIHEMLKGRGYDVRWTSSKTEAIAWLDYYCSETAWVSKAGRGASSKERKRRAVR